ncbi:hypothetical protein RhiirB3_458133, partial [Rhizophagus irregularis]
MSFKIQLKKRCYCETYLAPTKKRSRMENNTFTFHVLLPENIERNGQPVVLGD